MLLLGPGASPGPVVALLSLAYVGLGVAVLARGPRLERRQVVGLGAALLALAVVRPPSGSHDLWAYVMYGRISGTHGVSPYVHPPKQFPLDPFLRRVDPQWRGSRSVYGPLFTLWSAVIVRIAGRSVLALRLAFQVTAAAAVGLAAYLVDRRSRHDVGSLALIVLNPLVVCSLVNDAHVDAIVGLTVLATVLLLERDHHARAGAMVGVAVLVKAIALVPAGALGLWLLMRRRTRPAVHYGLAAVAVILLGYALAGGETALGPLGSASARLTRASVWTPARNELVDARVDEGAAPSSARRAAGRLIGKVATLLVVVAAVGLVVRGTARSSQAVAAGGAVLAYMLLGAYVLPWYAAAGLFCLALWPRWPPTWILLIHAGLLQLTQVPGHHFIAPFARAVAPGHVLHVRVERFLLPPLELVLLAVAFLTARRGLPAEEPAEIG